MEEFKNRITEFVTSYLRISIRKFEETCGLPYSTIASIKVKGPSAEVLMKISDTYPELNMNWLIGGRGKMVNNSDQPISENTTTVNIGNWGDLVALINSIKK